MPTNKERRKVADRLRILAGHREVDKELVEDTLGLYLGECVDGYDPVSVSELASLIEPEPERKAKSKPFPIEKDTGYFDTTKCECGYLNDVSATYCGRCGGVIEVVEQ